jgi:hypothetical protein
MPVALASTQRSSAHLPLSQSASTLQVCRHATVECALLTVLGFYAALKVTAPSLLVWWP